MAKSSPQLCPALKEPRSSAAVNRISSNTAIRSRLVSASGGPYVMFPGSVAWAFHWASQDVAPRRCGSHPRCTMKGTMANFAAFLSKVGSKRLSFVTAKGGTWLLSTLLLACLAPVAHANAPSVTATSKGPDQINLTWSGVPDPGYGYLVEIQSDADDRYSSWQEVRPIPLGVGYTCDNTV